MQPLWVLDCVSLRGTDRPRLNELSCCVHAGVTAILGSSGAGKTSLLNVLAGMEEPDSGSIQQHPTAGSPGHLPVYWAPQGGGLWPHLSVRKHLAAVCEDPRRADKLLEEFDLISRQHAFPDELSQGERARLSVARALAVPASVLLFDEPLVHVDWKRRVRGWDVIRRHLQDTRTSVVLTTHEPDVVLREAEFVICLDDGRIVYEGEVGPLYHDPPDEMCGRFLGPLNWFTVDNQRWLPMASRSDHPMCVRPEQLVLDAAGEECETQLEVVASEFMGSHAETVVRRVGTDERRTVVHRPAVAPVVGKRVSVRVMSSRGQIVPALRAGGEGGRRPDEGGV